MKNWELHFSYETDGFFKDFWTAGSALSYAKKHFDEAPYIDLENKKANITVRLKSPDKYAWSRGMKNKE